VNCRLLFYLIDFAQTTHVGKKEFGSHGSKLTMLTRSGSFRGLRFCESHATPGINAPSRGRQAVEAERDMSRLL